LLKDVLDKQATEQRRTTKFLTFALGKREEKTNTEIMTDLSQKRYDPRSDVFMPRLFRKTTH
jgi:hypothetical protein